MLDVYGVMVVDISPSIKGLRLTMQLGFNDMLSTVSFSLVCLQDNIDNAQTQCTNT